METTAPEEQVEEKKGIMDTLLNREKKENHTIMSLNKRLTELEDMVLALVTDNEEMREKLESKQSTARKANSINKVEDFNDEEIPMPESDGRALVMNYADQMRSLDNAMRILAPSYIDKETNRHTPENLGAICGFKVTPDMHDALYADFKHEGGVVVAI